VKEARLNGAQCRLSATKKSLAPYSVSILGYSFRTAARPATKVDEDEAEDKKEKKDNKLLKRKLPLQKGG
jgi:hypothetical protein